MSERRDSIKDILACAYKGDWRFLSQKGVSATEKLEFFRQSPELRKLALKELGRSGVSFQKKLTKDIMSLLLQDFVLAQPDTPISPESSGEDEDIEPESDPLIPDEISDLHEDGTEEEEEITDTKDNTEEPDSPFKRAVLTMQMFERKQIASVLGFLWSLILLFISPYGIFIFLIGIIPLACGVFGNLEVRNSFKPFKWAWFALAFWCSPMNLFFFIFGLAIGIFVLIDDKAEDAPVIPEDKEDCIIARYYALSGLGIPIPWRKFTIERSGGKLLLSNIQKLYGGNNSQQFLYSKDPEIVSSFTSVFFGGYQYLTLKDTKTDEKILNVRLPKTIAQSLVSTGFLTKLCELAKSADEMGGGSRVLHS